MGDITGLVNIRKAVSNNQIRNEFRENFATMGQ